MRTVFAMAILLVLVGISCKTPAPKVSHTEAEKILSDAENKSTELKGWYLSTETDRMDNTPTVYLAKRAESGQGGILTIRCIRRRTELVVATNDILDNGNVPIRFDDAKPQQQVWSEASNHQGLFSPDPIGLARQLTKIDSLLFEYRPFDKQATTIEFKVAGLAENLGTIADACGWEKIDQVKAIAKATAKAAAERALRRDAKLREVISKHVRPCREDRWWCWYDEADPSFKNGGPPNRTKDGALDDAVQMAKSGRVFMREVAQIDSQLK
jgi:hypothetical protein